MTILPKILQQTSLAASLMLGATCGNALASVHHDGAGYASTSGTIQPRGILHVNSVQVARKSIPGRSTGPTNPNGPDIPGKRKGPYTPPPRKQGH
jgi:hypothetical protein